MRYGVMSMGFFRDAKRIEKSTISTNGITPTMVYGPMSFAKKPRPTPHAER